MTLKKQYENTKPIGVYAICNWGGLVVLDIEYGIDDKIVTAFDGGETRQHIRRTKIHTTPSGRSCVRRYGVRYYLDDIMRV